MSATETTLTTRKTRFANQQFFLGLAVTGLIVIALCTFAVFSVVRIQRHANQRTSENNLKELARALHKYNDAQKRLPDHAIVDQESGQPLLSWRVALLPYLGEKELYDQIRLDEAWDSEHNRQFWDKMPSVYQLPGTSNDGKTYYQVFQGEGALFCKVEKKELKSTSGVPQFVWSGTKYHLLNMPDGTSNTIFAVEAAIPVNWMEPRDIPFHEVPEGTSLSVLGKHWGDSTTNVGMCGGSVLSMKDELTPIRLQRAILPADGIVEFSGGCN